MGSDCASAFRIRSGATRASPAPRTGVGDLRLQQPPRRGESHPERDGGPWVRCVNHAPSPQPRRGWRREVAGAAERRQSLGPETGEGPRTLTVKVTARVETAVPGTELRPEKKKKIKSAFFGMALTVLKFRS